MKKRNNSIINHQLRNLIFNEIQNILLQRENSKKDMRKEKIHYKVGEYYIINCFRALNALIDRNRQVSEAIKFLEEKPSEQILKRYKMSHHEYFDYHHNVLLTYLASYPECIYQLINAVLNLGLAEKHVTFTVLESHKWIKDVDLVKEIKAVEKCRNNHALDRNQAIHQGRAKIVEELQLYFTIDFLTTNSILPKEKIEQFKKIRRTGFRKEVKKVLKPLKDDFVKMEESSNQVFNKLVTYFDFWSTAGKNFASLPCTSYPQK